MMLYILATTATGQEFAVVAGLADIGITAIVPRAVGERYIRKVRKYVPIDVPAIANYVFLAITEADWHRINWGFWITLPNEQRKRGRVYKTCIISTAEWAGVQRFAAAIEMDYQYAMANIENARWDAANPVTRPYVAPYDVAAKLHLLGGDLEARFIRSLGTVKAPLIEAETVMFGREVRVTVTPDQVKGIAAE